MAPSSDKLPFATLLPMVTVKLSSSNFLLWKTQISSILDCQNFSGYVDGSKPAPHSLFATLPARTSQIRLLMTGAPPTS
ncbi:hypothetical protein ACS0TY_035327 [Phlomoides rotata]